jgi:hypothetical protein
VTCYETGDGEPPLCGRNTRGKYKGFDRNFSQAIIEAEEEQVSHFFTFSGECEELKHNLKGFMREEASQTFKV